MKTGWLSPTGDFTEAQNCEHIFYARKILHKLDKEMVAGRPDDILLSLGYVHITISLLFMKCFRISWERTLTPEQIHFLRPYFESEDINVDEWDKIKFQEEVDRQ